MDEFTITREFDAPRTQVWCAWTDPEIAARWWHPRDVTTLEGSVHIDLREGGSYGYTMVGPNGEEWPTGGEYLEVREPERLRFTWGDPADTSGREAPVITVDLLETTGNRTTMTFRLQGLPNDSGNDASVFDGWTEAFVELDATLEQH